VKHLERRRPSDIAGFTLIEALIAATLMGMVLIAMGAITAQWLPGWNRGFMRVQRSERFAVTLNRLASDLAASEFITPNRESKLPIFEGTAYAVTLVRSAVGPNTQGGLEVVRIAEATDRQGTALLRMRAPFAPFGLGEVSADQLSFTDPVVLLRAPFRVSFSYSAGDGSWSDTWHNAGQLPAVVRFLVRDSTTGRTLAISSAAIIHVELPADCVAGTSPASGPQSSPAAGGAASPTANNPASAANAPDTPAVGNSESAAGSVCGRRAATLRHPSSADTAVGWEVFPAAALERYL
jgi:general secretion pathway protein J